MENPKFQKFSLTGQGQIMLLDSEIFYEFQKYFENELGENPKIENWCQIRKDKRVGDGRAKYKIIK
jgi:hypothetical protein